MRFNSNSQHVFERFFQDSSVFNSIAGKKCSLSLSFRC